MSKEKLLLVGAGGFGRMVAEQAMLQYDCAFVDDGQSVGGEICGIPVVDGLADLRELRKDYDLLVVASAITGFGHRCMRKQKHLTMRSPTSLLPVPTSVHTLSWDAVVWYCKMPVSRTVRPLATVFC